MTMNGPAQSLATRGWHLERLLFMALLNVPLTLLLGWGFFAKLPAGAGFAGWLSALLAWLSTAAILNFVMALLFSPVVALARRRWLTLYAAPAWFALLNLFVFIDERVLAHVGVHINRTVIDFITTPGGRGSITLGASTIWTGILAVLLIVAATYGVCFGGCRLIYGRWRPRQPRRLAKWSTAVLLALIVTDKAIYVWADASDVVTYTRLRGVFPLYIAPTAKRVLRRLGLKSNRDDPLPLSSVSSLNYPRAPISFGTNARSPNIVMIAIEGARFDMLTPKVMPNLDRWSRQCIVGRNHYSGGNASRFGVFAQLYGIYGTYWKPVWKERRSPVLLDALQARGYAFRILSCGDLNSPEFRQTAFVRVNGAVTDQWNGARVDRDRRMTDAFLTFLSERKRQQPFFAFLFYDASHQSYLFPPAHEVFTVPDGSEQINYVIGGNSEKMRVRKRRYQNSLHYIDGQIQRLLAALAAEKNLLEETLVFITGDHGEEFHELGGFGHNKAFHRYQTRTLMVARIPGEAPRTLQRLTSHYDFVPTIFRFMEVENPVADYSLGLPLTGDEAHRFVVVASYSDAAIVELDAITVFPTEAHGLQPVIVYDHDYRIIAEGRAAMRQKKDLFIELYRGRRAFAW